MTTKIRSYEQIKSSKDERPVERPVSNSDPNPSDPNSIDKLGEALWQAQQEMSMPTRDAKNDFKNYKYATLTSAIKASRPALYANGLSIFHLIKRDLSTKEIILRTILLHHASGQKIECDVPINPERKDAIQDFGSYLTYMRRYCYSAIIGLGVDEDDDGESLMQKFNNPAIAKIKGHEDRQKLREKRPIKKMTISEENINVLTSEVKNNKELLTRVLSAYNLKKLCDLPQLDFNECLDRVRRFNKTLENTQKNGVEL